MCIEYFWLLSVQGQFGVIRCISDFWWPCIYFWLKYLGIFVLLSWYVTGTILNSKWPSRASRPLGLLFCNNTPFCLFFSRWRSWHFECEIKDIFHSKLLHIYIYVHVYTALSLFLVWLYYHNICFSFWCDFISTIYIRLIRRHCVKRPFMDEKFCWLVLGLFPCSEF